MVSDPTALFIPPSPASSFPAHPGPGTRSRISPQWFTQVLVTQSCPTLRDPTNCSPPGYMPMGCSRQEYGSRLPFLSPEDLPDLGIEPGSPTLQADSLPFELQGSPEDVTVPNYLKSLKHTWLMVVAFKGLAVGENFCVCFEFYYMYSLFKNSPQFLNLFQS